MSAAAAALVVAASTAGAFALPRLTPRGVAGDADLELVLLHGTKADKESYPDDYKDDLKDKPPWNAYNHYEIVAKKKIALTKGAVVKEALPDGSTLEATLLEVTPKYKLEIIVKDGKNVQISKGTYKTAKGTRFLPVQTPYKGGGLVLSLKIL